MRNRKQHCPGKAVLLSAAMCMALSGACTAAAAGSEDEAAETVSAQEMESFCLDTPSLTSAHADVDGTTISWKKVDRADGYAVLRKEEDGEWKLIALTESLSYTDSTSSSDGSTRCYTVRAFSGNRANALLNRWDGSCWSDCDPEGVSAVSIGVPELHTLYQTDTGTWVSWGAAENASGYALYRKSESGGWKLVTITDELYYHDQTELASGVTYIYTVRAYTGSLADACANLNDAAYWGGYDPEGAGCVYLSAPDLDMAYAAATGTRISWDTVDGADGYAIFRKAENGSWILLDMTEETLYTDTAVLETGTTYSYTVRAFKGDADAAKRERDNPSYWSGYDSTGVKATYLGTPVLKEAAVSSSLVSVSWEPVDGADGYAVYRRETDGAWELLGTTEHTRYIDTSALPTGTTCYYTVRAYVNGTAGSAASAEVRTDQYSALYWSGFEPVGLDVDCGYKTNALTLAAQFIENNTTSDMTQRQKLDTCFSALLRLSYTRTYDTADASNLSSFAEQLFVNRTGNCYRYAAGFACIAAVLGYDVRVNVGQITARGGGLTPHGWTEVCVDGVWYLCDPDMQAFNSNYSGQYYMTSASAIGLTYAITTRYTLTIVNGTAVWS
ncbi:MAG: transglutaminase domain-containing protein [Lachnospiraceae bacterium]|nr:transglutaminase domain-containing protein [Lachnospiraceae bacterium]